MLWRGDSSLVKIEVLIVDGMSGDATVQVAETYPLGLKLPGRTVAERWLDAGWTLSGLHRTEPGVRPWG